MFVYFASVPPYYVVSRLYHLTSEYLDVNDAIFSHMRHCPLIKWAEFIKQETIPRVRFLADVHFFFF